MKTMLRNLARKYANRMLVRSNDTLRRELIGAQARANRLAQNLEHLRRLNLANFGARCRAETELEEALVAQSGKGLDDVWPSVAGVAGPETSRP